MVQALNEIEIRVERSYVNSPIGQTGRSDPVIKTLEKYGPNALSFKIHSYEKAILLDKCIYFMNKRAYIIIV